MIHPENIVRYDYTDRELEELLIFCICVAGKTAKTIAPRVHKLVRRKLDLPNWKNKGYLDRCACMGTFLPSIMQSLGIGCYKQKAETIQLLAEANLDLRTCTVEDLETIKGIGPKTSRFFLMSSRKGVQYAALDTHILKWLGEQGIDVPKATPKGKRYKTLEAEYLALVPEGKTPAEFDLEIWKSYRSE